MPSPVIAVEPASTQIPIRLAHFHLRNVGFKLTYFVGGRRHRLSTAEVNNMPMKILKDR
jgi:hypothetical protein